MKMNHSWKVFVDPKLIHDAIYGCEFDLWPGPRIHPDDLFPYVYWIMFSVFATNIVVATGSVIFGVTSWILIKRWRQFKNYVFLNVIIMSIITLLMNYTLNRTFFYAHLNNGEVFDITYFQLPTCKILVQVAFVLSRIAMSHWLLVATVMFYMDIVKVFNNRIRHRYLITNLFTWVGTLLEGSVLFLTVWLGHLKVRHVGYISFGITCFYKAINTVLYLRVLYTLITLANRDKSSRKNVCQNITFSTAACVTSAISFYPPMLLAIDFTQNITVRHICIIVSLLSLFGVLGFFLSMRSHRKAWRNHLQRRKARSMDTLANTV